jgi:hypothetical protein
MEDIMPVTLPIEIYETLEKTVGKEGAKAVIKSIESTISEYTEYKLRTSKDELLDVMRKEFVTKDFFEERLNSLREELIGIMKQDKAELLGIMKQDKAELLGIMKQDKAELLGIIKQDKAELLGKIDALYEKTEKDKTELMGIIEKNRLEVEKEILRIDRKFTIMFVILFFTILFLNQNALEFIFRIMGLIR